MRNVNLSAGDRERVGAPGEQGCRQVGQAPAYLQSSSSYLLDDPNAWLVLNKYILSDKSCKCRGELGPSRAPVGSRAP